MILQTRRVKLCNPYVLYAIVPAFHGEKLNIFVILVSLYMLLLVCWLSEMSDVSHPDVCIWMQDEVKWTL